MKKYIKASDNTDANPALDKITNNPQFMRIKAVALKFGYDVDYAYVDKYSNINISIYPNGSLKYTPELRISKRSKGYGLPRVDDMKVSIQTVAYGAMGTEIYPEFLSACNDAFNFAQFLESFDGYAELARLDD